MIEAFMKGLSESNSLVNSCIFWYWDSVKLGLAPPPLWLLDMLNYLHDHAPVFCVLCRDLEFLNMPAD